MSSLPIYSYLVPLLIYARRPAADANSVYDPYPRLTYSWDPDVPASGPTITRARAQSSARPNGAGHSLDLWPHPTDPMSNVRLPESGAPLVSPQPGPQARTENASGQEIWVYCGAQGCVIPSCLLVLIDPEFTLSKCRRDHIARTRSGDS